MEDVTISMESDYLPTSNLPAHSFDKLKSEFVQTARNVECSVCLEKLNMKEQAKRLPCGHLFHEKCVRPWFSTNTKCPNCRFDVKEATL